MTKITIRLMILILRNQFLGPAMSANFMQNWREHCIWNSLLAQFVKTVIQLNVSEKKIDKYLALVLQIKYRIKLLNPVLLGPVHYRTTENPE